MSDFLWASRLRLWYHQLTRMRPGQHFQVGPLGKTLGVAGSGVGPSRGDGLLVSTKLSMVVEVTYGRDLFVHLHTSSGLFSRTRDMFSSSHLRLSLLLPLQARSLCKVSLPAHQLLIMVLLFLNFPQLCQFLSDNQGPQWNTLFQLQSHVSYIDRNCHLSVMTWGLCICRPWNAVSFLASFSHDQLTSMCNYPPPIVA